MAQALLDRGRLFLTMALVLSLTGALLWMTMVRQEDPLVPDYWGLVTVSFPGADALTMEHLVLKPIEDALIEVDEVKIIISTAFDEMIVLEVELGGRIRNFDQTWDDVRRALERAKAKFPSGAEAPTLNRNIQEPDAVVLAVTGSADLLKLRNAALRVKDHLSHLPGVSKVNLVADPGEQVTIHMDDPTAKRIGISPDELAAQLTARNRIIPGGSIELAGMNVRLRPLSEFKSVSEIALTPVVLPSGATILLQDLASVRHGVLEPGTSRMRFNGETAVGVSVTPKKNSNIVTFGKEVRSAIESARQEILPLQLQEVSFQPDHTAKRLSDLNLSLLSAMMIVSGILILTMGPRMGLVVTAVIPLAILSSLTLFAWGGGILHQISIAAFIMALGMLVDNAIVMAENVQYRLDQGASGTDASLGAVRELAIPLLGATATTLAAFVPMYISQGVTADFTRTIPVIIMTCLAVSFCYAMLVTPVLCRMVLKPSPVRRKSYLVSIGYCLADFALRHSKFVVLMALLLIGIVLMLGMRVEQQFFPSADRNQFVVDLKLQEGSHLTATERASRVMENVLLEQESVDKVSSFIGRGAPLFYYTIILTPYSPHFAQLIVETRHISDVAPLVDHVSSVIPDLLPGVEVIIRKLEQGPPIQAPVEIRLFGHDFQDLHRTASAVTELLSSVEGTRDVRHDMSPGSPTIRLHIDDAAAGRHGLSREDVSQALLGRTRGLEIGEIYLKDDPVPVFIRSTQGEHLDATALAAIDLRTAQGTLIPMESLARQELDWVAAAINHRNGKRVVTVSSQLSHGVSYSQVLKALQPGLSELELPPGVEIAFGGELEGAGEANMALMTVLPIGFLMLFGVLLAEFNSFKRVALVLMTVPLAAVGIVPGLLLNNQPFGFMSLLGVFALAGVVVNNAIVLLELIEQERRKGADVGTAVRDAVARRIRPILLTTGTTVAGLLPLAVSSSTLWPPLASAMISGLLASTALTLIILPAAYRLIFAPGAVFK
ncbi:efflux RND transporter permease subunit [Desulfonatronovibrio magnus]|uniref:efflux RND transporter permease subunit n=1 Tax=Desulfonatronovibrio magnus TaxID=698827 RepID=UPI0005EBCB07|nr:efflux RND transporter permease subunit [Desulfonatronovibrio magnus]